MLAHPEIPTCGECAKYRTNTDFSFSKRDGKRVPRAAGEQTPCWKCPKAVEGRPNPGADFSGKNLLAYHLYLTIQAGMPMPDDPIVRRNCALIRMVQDQYQQLQPYLATLAVFGGKPNGRT